jgi:outer membrane protein assembly factor BamB
VAAGKNIAWKVAVPGLAHSSPIVWGDRVYVTTAISKDGEVDLKVGLYGDADSAKDMAEQSWMLYCFDKKSGKKIWETRGCRSVPRVARHTKATHCNSTLVTDGKHIVTFLGSEGLYCFDMSGKRVWRKDLGKLDAGPRNYKELQWGFASSPVLHDGRVFVQCDTHDEHFVACFDIADGKEVWRTKRDDATTWSTPTVYFDGGTARLAVNGEKEIAGYDLKTGKQVWKLSGGGDVPVPTPVVAKGMLFITSAHGGPAPLFAIRLDARGELEEKKSDDKGAIAWSVERNGAYMQTPVVYGEFVYSCSDRGVLKCFDVKSGEMKYQERLGKGNSGYTASPVAGDGKIYFASEDGDVHVISPGAEFKELAKNSMDEVCMASPAISEGTIFIRTRGHLVAVAEKK